MHRVESKLRRSTIPIYVSGEKIHPMGNPPPKLEGGPAAIPIEEHDGVIQGVRGQGKPAQLPDTGPGAKGSVSCHYHTSPGKFTGWEKLVRRDQQTDSCVNGEHLPQ